jgi:malate synthase
MGHTPVTPTRAAAGSREAAVPAGVVVRGARADRFDEILTPAALDFLAALVREFRPRVEERLRARAERRERWQRGERLDFLRATRAIRAAEWTVAPLPLDLERRTVEITGPVDRKMIINALNSGADCFMADFEDSSAPVWDVMVQGQVNLRDAVRRTITHDDPATGKHYALGDETATLLVRPRGWHLVEHHVDVDGEPVPAALFDFGLFLFHNAAALLAAGTGPYFYLPKLESHLEARLWNDVFVFAQDRLGVPRGSIRATVLVETLPAAFEMDEILYELREHSAGLNCGRWDYIFSFIKVHRHDPAAVLPDRSQVTMEQPFMRAYATLCVKTCHRRGAPAMGGMAAQIPIKSDPVANDAALAKVRADKLREVRDGHDGTWVAHPGLVALAREVFESEMPGPNQIHRKRDDVRVEARDLLELPSGTRTEAGLRHNVRVGIQYLESWLRGTGCVPLYDLMEDAATAEISRTQIWQWLHHGATLADGRVVDPALVERVIDEEMHVIRREVGDARADTGRFAEARALFQRLSDSACLEEFLTTAASLLLDEGNDRIPAGT